MSRGRHIDHCFACRERFYQLLNEELDSTEDIIGSIWGRIELAPDASEYSRLHEPVINDLTVEVVKKYEMQTTYNDDDTKTIPEEYVEVLTDEGKSEVWILSAFVITHYRLPGR